ncbi:uncharacterized protein Pyn_01052 [Prunus yedoensis var. nudiflora]|uniref:Agenet-like domain-containing protein n=1 Tax=Prunus yedoensis var. nudiflora TaxID=2094558 RepID=A0A314UGH5_PRUYE|nr:uncharacterized protein Pyn_01052 [Prunus yedoensis var. nudiflora]
MNKPLVQYENLASDDDPNKLLTELVDASSIRPVPPENPDQPFEPPDVVNAFYTDVWWVGSVMRCEDQCFQRRGVFSSAMRGVSLEALRRKPFEH